MKMMKISVCVVENCGTKQKYGDATVGHRFPNNEEIGNLWIKSVANPELEKKNLVEIVRRRYFVCAKHFSEKCFFYTGKGVRKLYGKSLPTLHLPNQMQLSNKIDVEAMDNTTAINVDLDEKMQFSSMGDMNFETCFSTETVSIKIFEIFLKMFNFFL